MHIILYSTGCPKCIVLEKKLKSKDIKYELNTSVDDMLELGILSAPILSIDENLLQFKDAVDWINKLN